MSRVLSTAVVVTLLIVCADDGRASQIERRAALPPQRTVSGPAPGTAPAIAGGAVTVVAWLEQTPGTERVIGRAGDDGEILAMGPAGPGIDGAPVAAAVIDGSVWVVASRNDGSSQRLWARRWTAGAWQVSIAGPVARPRDHHPALVAQPGSGRLWATWIGEDGADRNGAMLFASHWNGRNWTAAESLPRTAGIPMAPSIAVDTDGAPVVVWAAGSGANAEIWASKRQGGRWSTPFALSRNLVPDITPSIAGHSGGLVVTWISYTDEGYLPLVRIGADADSWGETHVISETPGGRPRAISVDGNPVVFWRHLEERPAGGTIKASMRRDGNWGAPVSIASASGSPFGVARSRDDRLMLAFARPDGRLGVAEGDRSTFRDDLDSLMANSAARYGPVAATPRLAVPAPATDHDPPLTPVPENYTAFGDSIANGVVYDPVRRASAGYRDPLQKALRNYFGVGTVFNAGVDGEPTSDGLGRIDNAISTQDPGAILILEGTNDIIAAIDVSIAASNLRSMLQRAEVEKPGILRFLGTLPPRLDPRPEGFDGPGNGRIDELNAMLAVIGPEEGAFVVDLNTPLDGHPELMSNHLHPSVAGYEVMAGQWFDVAKPEVLALTNFGDVDSSGRTDGLDLIRLALAFGAIVGEDRYDADADINGDGIIDGFDLDLLVEFFGLAVPPEVPKGS